MVAVAVLVAVLVTVEVETSLDFAGAAAAVVELEARVVEEDLTRVVLGAAALVGLAAGLEAVDLLAKDLTSPFVVGFLSPAADAGFGEETDVLGLGAAVLRRGVIFVAVVEVFGAGLALKVDVLLAIPVAGLVSSCFGLDIVVDGFFAAAAVVRAAVLVFVGEVGNDFVGFDAVEVFVVEVFEAVVAGFFVAFAAAVVAATTAAPAIRIKN